MVSDLLEIHRRTLELWRVSMNLVGPGDVGEHYADASAALEGLAPAGRWVDLGTGAGFPGIVFADRFPDVTLELVDSRRKRCVFLEHVLAEAGVPPSRVRVRCERVEALPNATYDGVMARAFAPPVEVLAVARRLLVPGGTVLLFLQSDGEGAGADDFEVIESRGYSVGERRRKVVSLRLRP